MISVEPSVEPSSTRISSQVSPVGSMTSWIRRWSSRRFPFSLKIGAIIDSVGSGISLFYHLPYGIDCRLNYGGGGHRFHGGRNVFQPTPGIDHHHLIFGGYQSFIDRLYQPGIS